MTNDVDSIRQDLRRLLALLALEQLDPCDAIVWARSVVAHVHDSPGLRVLAGCDRDSVSVWLRHAAEDLCVVFPNREQSAKILAQIPTSEQREGTLLPQLLGSCDRDPRRAIDTSRFRLIAVGAK